MSDDQAASTARHGGPAFERFRDGWLLVDRDGRIASLYPMPEETARGFAEVMGIEFPDDSPR